MLRVHKGVPHTPLNTYNEISIAQECEDIYNSRVRPGVILSYG